MKEQRNRRFDYAGRRISIKGNLASISLPLGLILLCSAAIPVGTYLQTADFMLNAGITGIIFLSVFFIQRSGKRTSKAMQVEVNPTRRGARYLGSRIVHVEEMNEEELDHLHAYYQRLSDTKD
jgi:low affinity Fe/Cu permease